MLTILSPAKKMRDYSVEFDLTSPHFNEPTTDLLGYMKTQQPADLQRMMKISPNLAELNYNRYQNFDDLDKTPALYAFCGDTYAGFNADTLDAQHYDFTQKNIRILSGLYGWLRPFDAIRPYRLEMGRRVNDQKLSDYWRPHLETIVPTDEPIIHCASNEYGESLPKGLNIITPKFYEIKDGTAKMIGLYAKRARGMLARYIVDNGITDPQDLRSFNTEGYIFDAQQSNDTTLIFNREHS